MNVLAPYFYHLFFARTNHAGIVPIHGTTGTISWKAIVCALVLAMMVALWIAHELKGARTGNDE